MKTDDTEKKIQSINLSAWFGSKQALKDINLIVRANAVTAIIGPSGCGKSTFIRCLNRMHEVVPGAKASGKVLVDDRDIYDRDIDPVDIRRRIGMVFQKPNPFPKSIYENVAWGARINGYRGSMDELVEQSLRQAALWDEVKDVLHRSGNSLSGGQQQRLCIARTIAVKPEVILMDIHMPHLDGLAALRLIKAELSEVKIVMLTISDEEADTD